MSNLDFDGLMKLDEKGRSKLSKQELVEAVGRYSFYYKNNIEAVKTAQDQLVLQSKNEDAVKSILISYLDLPLTSKNECGQEVGIEYNLLNLVGKLLSSKL